MKIFYTIALLIISNICMTFAWYSHLKLEKYTWFSKLSLPLIILFSWGIALFEYAAMIPANRIGYIDNGGPFNLWQLKILQEVITLVVFIFIAIFVFKTEGFRWNYVIGCCFLVAAVYFFFKK